MFIATHPLWTLLRSEERQPEPFLASHGCRSSERSRRCGGLVSYKHCTPNGVKKLKHCVFTFPTLYCGKFHTGSE